MLELAGILFPVMKLRFPRRRSAEEESNGKAEGGKSDTHPKTGGKGLRNGGIEERRSRGKCKEGRECSPSVTAEPVQDKEVSDEALEGRKKRIRGDDMAQDDLQETGTVESKVARKKACRRVLRVLEQHGPKRWKSIEDFVDYLKEWQERNGVRLVHLDSKGAEAHNASCGLRAGDCRYIPVEESKFAYKSWVCIRGRKKRSTTEAKGLPIGDDQSKAPRLCGFRVRARYLPSQKKVTCTVSLHEGPDTLPNGHNHQLSKGKRKRAENEELVLRSLKQSPEEAIALLGSWRVEQRKRFCETVFRGAAEFISNPDECSLRRMVEVLMMVKFLAAPSGKSGSETTVQMGEQPTEVQREAMPRHKGKETKEIIESTAGSSSRNAGSEDSHHRKQEKLDLFSELPHGSTSPKKSVHLRAAPITSLMMKEEKGSLSDISPGGAGKEKVSRMSVEEVLKLSAKRRVTFGDLLQQLDKFPTRRKDRFLRVAYIKSIKEMEFETQTLASGSVDFLLEEEKLDGVLRRVDRFRKGIRVTRSMRSCVSRRVAQDMMVLLDDERDLGSYVVCIEVPKSWAAGEDTSSEYLLSGQILADMRRVWDLIHLLEEGKVFLDWVRCIDPANKFELKEELAIHRSKLYVKGALESLSPANWQCDNGKHGFAYNLRSLFRFRGSVREKLGKWLDSDALQMCLLSIRSKMEPRMKKFVFLMPLFQWDLDSSKRLGLRMKSSKQLFGGASGNHGKGQTEYLIELLEKQSEAIVSAEPIDLGHAVVYASVNKEQNHWLAVEACLRMKEAIVYDPAMSSLTESAEDPAHYFEKLRSVLELLLLHKEVTSPNESEWKCCYDKGGQQKIEDDAINCGLYAVQWIKHRLRTVVARRLSKEENYNFSYIDESLGDTRKMRRLEPWETEACRLWLAHDALSAIKGLRVKR